MFVRLENTPRDYAWGSTTAIADLLGRERSGGPEAELWLGTHAGSPTRIADPTQVGGYETLAQWVAAEPDLQIGFLLKILAAAHPLSLQAHPSLGQAEEGFAREEAAGVPVSSPSRNYKDRNHKPELIVALSPTFDALCGFRPSAEVACVLHELIDRGEGAGHPVDAVAHFAEALAHHGDPEHANAWALEWLLTGGDGVHDLVSQCTAIANGLATDITSTNSVTRGHEESTPALVSAVSTVRELAAEYPCDPGIVLALLLNRVSLKRGEALYLPAGNMHAYLSGLGVELMASSDNVLRGGLTPKHIDVAELRAITQCKPLAIPALAPKVLAPGVQVFAPDIPDFALVHASLQQALNGGHASISFGGPAILICTAGEISLTGEESSTVVHRGDFFFVTPSEHAVKFDGFGEIFIAQQGLVPVSAA